MTTEASIFDRPVPVPEEYQQRARERGWPGGLIERAFQLRVARPDVEYWLSNEQQPIERIEDFLRRRETLMSGTIHVREATWADDEAVADLYANSPEDVGDWEVTVERSPYAFAQFRLQEHVNMQIVEDRGIVLGAAAHSGRNTIIEGQRVSAHVATAWRVRRGFRGQGISKYLQMGDGPACAWFGVVNYWYVRAGNAGGLGWIRAIRPDMAEAMPEDEGELPGLPVTVHHFRARPFEGDAGGIRPARRSDTRRCVALINRTQRGLDLFRPYTEEFLHQRLDDPMWGPRPAWWQPVYCWDDYFVLEEEGAIVACAGLWDRGRHVREAWVHTSTGERMLLERTALMDFGCAKGREDALARLTEFLLGRTHELGRGELMAAIERSPALVEQLARHEPSSETRALAYSIFNEDGVDLHVKIRRPYTDLAYW